MILTAFRNLTLLYIWIWSLSWCYANASIRIRNQSKFLINFFDQQSQDGFNGISGTKQRKQNELLLQIALFYICLQLALKSFSYFLMTSFPQTTNRKSDRNVHRTTEISMIRFN